VVVVVALNDGGGEDGAFADMMADKYEDTKSNQSTLSLLLLTV
jgi:hypothetical protein